MKSTLLLLSLVVLMFTACKKDDIIVEDADVIVSEDNVDEILIAGTWYIASSTKSNGNSNTADYAGYTFNFEAANALSIKKDGETDLVGWQAGSGSKGVKIEFEVPGNLPQEIQDIGDGKWYVTRLTKTRLTMQEEEDSDQEITLRKN